jgi:hypothetical protein
MRSGLALVRYDAKRMWVNDQWLSADQRATLEREVVGLHSLHALLQWAFSQSPPCDIAEVVVQDEFSHDVVLPWHDVYLVFDTT